MSTAIQGFGQQVPPATNYSQSLSFDGQLPPGGPQPPPASVQSAFQDSHLPADSFTPSAAASVLLASTATPAATNSNANAKAEQPVQPQPAATPQATAGNASAQTVTTQAQNPSISVIAQARSDETSPLKEFEANQGPPPYTLSNALPDPNKINEKALTVAAPSPFQIRQFSDLIKTIRSITASVLPNFSYTA